MGNALPVSKTGSALREEDTRESLPKIEELGRATWKLSHRGQAGMEKKGRTGGWGGGWDSVPGRKELIEVQEQKESKCGQAERCKTDEEKP